MPLKEPDAEDPMELVGVELPVDDVGVTEQMAECFIEEYLMMGYSTEQLFRIFTNPFYAGAYDVGQRLGVERVVDLISRSADTLGRA